MLNAFVKSYRKESPHSYIHTTLVRHKGVVLAFALDDQRRISYAVLDVNPTAAAGASKSPFDVENWPAGPTELIFPAELAETGFGVADQKLLPSFRKGSRVQQDPAVRLDPRDRDVFLSTTARFTAAVPFQILSDGRFVYVFRQAIRATDPDMIWVDSAGHRISSADGTKAQMLYADDKGYHRVYLEKNGQPELARPELGEPVPLVNNTLLVDRFLLVGARLVPQLEVRFQRSRSKTRAQSRKDGLGAKDLDGNPFYEPTKELRFLGNLTGGRFAVLLLPTQIAGLERWQIFTQNSITGRIDAFNIERAVDGLFNLRGALAEGVSGQAESALQLTAGSHVFLKKNVPLGAQFTLESWINPAKSMQVEPQVLLAGGAAFSVAVLANTRLQVRFNTDQSDVITSESILTPETWNHIAISFDGAAFRFFINGLLRDKKMLPEGKTRQNASLIALGAPENGFAGVLDELRCWNRVRSGRELKADMNIRLTGLEPGLNGYWRFDEGAGGTVFDQSNFGADGTLAGGIWITSDAPVGENAGINRNSFQLASDLPDGKLDLRSAASGFSAMLYYQQAAVPSGYDGRDKPLKQNARVMLTLATSGGIPDDHPYIAALDFGVSATGRLAQIPDLAPLALLQPGTSGTASVNERLDRIGGLEREVRLLDPDIDRLTAAIGVVPSVIAVLDAALSNPGAEHPQITEPEFRYLNPKLAALRQAEIDLNGARAILDQLNTLLFFASVTVYEDSGFGGRSLTLGRGFTGYTFLKENDFNDRITGLSIPAPLQVTAYKDANRGGESRLFQSSTSNVGGDWNDKISSMDIEESAVWAAQRAAWNTAIQDGIAALNAEKAAIRVEKNTLNDKIAALQAEKAAKEARRSAAQHELNELKTGLKSGASVVMPLVHLDPNGLSVSGGLLGFAWSNSTPLLFDSATGSLALYFRGTDDQFFVAYFNTFTERAKYPLVAAGRQTAVLAVARSTDLDMDKLSVTVGGDENSPFCTLIVEGAGITETWRRLPRRPDRMARILNGEAGHTENGKRVGYREYVGAGALVREAGVLKILLPGGLKKGLEAGAALVIGDIRATTLESVQASSPSVLIDSRIAELPAGNLPVYFLEYDYADLASTTKVPGDLIGGSLLLRAVATGAGAVLNQRVSGGATVSSQWTAAAPGNTLAFDGKDVTARPPEPVNLEKFDHPDDLSLEAWVRPDAVNAQARIVRHKSADSDYTLGLQKKELNSSFVLDGEEDYISIPAKAALNFSGAITVEAWIKPKAIDGTRNIAVHGYPHVQKPELFLRIEAGHYQFGFHSGQNTLAQIPVPVSDGLGNAWIHLAGVYDPVAKHWILYRNGVPGAPFASGSGAPAVEALWGIGANPNPGAKKADRRFFKGELDEVRVWKRARTHQEILNDMNRRLVGNETDLEGLWYMDGGKARDFSKNKNDGNLVGRVGTGLSPLPGYTFFAGVNGKYVQAKKIFPAGRWTHLGAVYQQGYGLRFDGLSGYLNAGKDESLNINTDLSLELWFQAETQGGGLLTRGRRDDGTAQNVPYALYLNTSGKVVFRFEDENGEEHEFTSAAALTAGAPHRVAVTRKRRSLTHSIEDGDNSKVFTFSWDDIMLYLDNNAPEDFKYTYDDKVAEAIEEAQKSDPRDGEIKRLVGSYDADELQVTAIGRSDDALEIGRGDEDSYFKGIISEVRIWNAALEAGAIGAVLQGKEEGLVSWWRFEEREGVKAFDSNGKNDADFHGSVRWAKDPDLSRSSLTLYADDSTALQTETRPAPAAGQNRFCLGGVGDTTPTELFQGELEELRIWKTARTREQIQDNLFRRLNGELDDLIAYYTFDAETQNQLTDNALRGNHLQVAGPVNFVFSTAPIGDDAPQVRSALAGIRTPFSGRIHSSPAVHEYGDLQYDSRNNFIGVFKRCYGYLTEGAWQLVTGFKVGDLITEWIGQVQFAPQLKGFIEGAPPVPSENLTQPSVEMIGDLDDYNEASKIELIEAEETTHTYTAAKEQGFGLEVEAGVKFGFKSQSEAGLGFISSVEESKVLFGIKAKFEAMWNWMEEASISAGRASGKSTSIELRGRYTSPEENENEPYGRRFVADNVGLALVQSETADVYALRLKHNNALISFALRPNADIPKDWNIITFPINPYYTKQGTLDGKIGPNPDPDYPNAFEYSNDISYFKPREAYKLRDRIDRERSELETYYNAFAATDKGRLAYFPTDSAADLTEAAELRKKLHRNIVNTYVWTSDGGLFAETHENIEVQTESTAGSYEFKGAAGFDLNIGFAIAKVAAVFELSALFVGQHKLHVAKSAESKTSFQLNVSVDKVERDIYKRDARKVVITDNSDPKRPKPVKNPGKVDAYRFMTFYLEPESDHFDTFFNQIVDPRWLEQSDDPGAAALRETRQAGQKPACWRILHRVTYVSRVLPPFDPAAPPSLEKALQTLDIDSNYELIKQLEPYVANRLGSFPEFAEAVRETLRQNLPELLAHSDDVIRYMSLYFGIVDGQMPAGTDERFGESTFFELAPNQPPIVNAGLDQILGLDGAPVATDLEAVVIDDRLEKAEAIFTRWEKTAGPGPVSFDDQNVLKTKARFYQRGRYTLALTANDGLLSAAHAITVRVHERPVISAKKILEISTLERKLEGEILDSGLGDPQNDTSMLTANWSLKNLPAGSSEADFVTFEDKQKLITKATFKARGHYLLRLSVSNGAFTTEDEVLVSVASRSSAQLEALYTFEENAGLLARDASGREPALDLQWPQSPAVEWLAGGLRLKTPVLLGSAQTAARLSAAVKASNELSVEAWIEPGVQTTARFNRIITLSGSPAARNFSLGQKDGRFRLALRADANNPNADHKALEGGEARPGVLTHVLCTRNAAGMTRLYINGIEQASRTVRGDFSAWDTGFRLGLGNEFGPGDDGIDRSWTGTYRLVALYSRALSPLEVRQHFEFGPDADLPPIVHAGSVDVVNWADFDWNMPDNQSKIIELKGRVTHDRPAAAASVRWEQVSGPAAGVEISDADKALARVRLRRKGRYSFRFSANDGRLTSITETPVTVHCPPHVVFPQPRLYLALGLVDIFQQFKSELRDNGLADNPNAPLSYAWSRRLGPDSMTFDRTDQSQTTVRFRERGLYELQLEASNGLLPARTALKISVDQMPNVDAGRPVSGLIPAGGTSFTLQLAGRIKDTGLSDPADRLAVKWETVSGPGAVTFADPADPKTKATFEVSGVYVLSLTAIHPQLPGLTTSDKLQVTIHRAPKVDAGPDPAPIKLVNGVAALWLEGVATDDGFPDLPGQLSLRWVRTGGPEAVTFAPEQGAYTRATFRAPGEYVLRLEALDGSEAFASDEVKVVVS